ncbi:class II peroxidase [Bipolaris oryzae ATCC 44560]|uniref:Peroxidase n=1 Tax=Bipolaris oryzae ATCC 44560 TaxID=930090 RepID=W6ZFW3_COCMI|nr:class II peroxidase [Bipolaris oryzae ATCC 44560]EUC42396.1 class II peroxidase [Bipolaris oryzae ATCC 44560]
MRPAAAITLLALAVTPISATDISPRAGGCPGVWQAIAGDLKNIFQGCNKAARSAVRAVFHDCMPDGCNGSLILSEEECSRVENLGLKDLCKTLNQKRRQYGVGAADMVQFAGAMALSACPLGPKVDALVGRRDSYKPAPPNGLPRSSDPVAKILGMFAAKGFYEIDVVALLGTHSIALQFQDDPSKAGRSLDSSPAVCDIRYFAETMAGTAPYSLASDRLMATTGTTRKSYAVFAKSTKKWADAFVPAWNRLAVIGNDVHTLQDCSYLIPKSEVPRARGVAHAQMMEKLAKKFIGEEH